MFRASFFPLGLLRRWEYPFFGRQSTFLSHDTDRQQHSVVCMVRAFLGQHLKYALRFLHRWQPLGGTWNGTGGRGTCLPSCMSIRASHWSVWICGREGVSWRHHGGVITGTRRHQSKNLIPRTGGAKSITYTVALNRAKPNLFYAFLTPRRLCAGLFKNIVQRDRGREARESR